MGTYGITTDEISPTVFVVGNRPSNSSSNVGWGCLFFNRIFLFLFLSMIYLFIYFCLFFERLSVNICPCVFSSIIRLITSSQIHMQTIHITKQFMLPSILHVHPFVSIKEAATFTLRTLKCLPYISFWLNLKEREREREGESKRLVIEKDSIERERERERERESFA